MAETITCTPNACTVPSVDNAHADGVCGTEDDGVTAVTSIDNGLECTVVCDTGYTASSDNVACTAGNMAETITCTPNACTVPSVDNAHADGVCGTEDDGVTAVTSIDSGQDCTVECADGFTASDSTVACTAGAMAPPTCSARRRLQANTTANSNITTTMIMATTTEEECACEAPAPQVITTFSSTLAFSDPSELTSLDMTAMKANLASDQDWGEASVEVTAVIKVAVPYTLPEGIEITPLQCKTAIASAYSVSADMVTCAAGTAASATAGTTTTLTTTAAARRLQDEAPLTGAVDVQIDYAEEEAEMAASAASADTDDMAAVTVLFTAALVDDGAIDAGTVLTAGVPTAEVVMSFVVTSDSAVEAPPAAAFESVLSASGITVVATVSEAEISYSRMPCSEGTGVCATGYQLRADASSIGCVAELCEPSADSENCCTQVSTNGAHAKCVMGSLSILVLSSNFFF